MTRDQLRLVLQPDDQLVKIKTVTAIDDHSDGEHPGVEQDLQSRQVYFRGAAVEVAHDGAQARPRACSGLR